MASRNQNTVAAVMVALFCMVIAGCLVVALVVPAGWVQSLRLGKVAAILAVIAIPVLYRLAERSRIRRAVEEMHGTVLRLRRLPFWRQGWDYYSLSTVAPKYEIVFADLPGNEIRAICRSGFLRGVEWLSMEPLQGVQHDF